MKRTRECLFTCIVGGEAISKPMPKGESKSIRGESFWIRRKDSEKGQMGGGLLTGSLLNRTQIPFGDAVESNFLEEACTEPSQLFVLGVAVNQVA